MSGNSWTGSQPTGHSIPTCSSHSDFPAATQPQIKSLHHSTTGIMPAANTPAPLHQSITANATAGSQHQISTSRTAVPSPFLEPQQPQQRGGIDSNQLGPPPLQPTPAQVFAYWEWLICQMNCKNYDNFLAACCWSGAVSGEVCLPLLCQAGRQVWKGG